MKKKTAYEVVVELLESAHEAKKNHQYSVAMQLLDKARRIERREKRRMKND